MCDPHHSLRSTPSGGTTPAFTGRFLRKEAKRQQFRLCCKKVDTLVNSASIREQKRSFLHEEPESVQMASFRSRDHSALCPLLPPLLSQLPGSGGHDAGMRAAVLPHHDLPLDAVLRP